MEDPRNLLVQPPASRTTSVDYELTVNESPVVLNPMSAVVLGALQGKQLYAGTAHPYRVAERRAKNKRARASRKRNRSK